MFLAIPVITVLVVLHKRRQRQEEESLTTTRPFQTGEEQAPMVENFNVSPLTLSHERLSAPLASKFRAAQPDPNSQSSTSTLPQSPSLPTDISDDDQANLIVPTVTLPGNPPPNSVVGGPGQERTMGSDITMIERISRAVLQGLPLRRLTTREEDPPRYEE